MFFPYQVKRKLCRNNQVKMASSGKVANQITYRRTWQHAFFGGRKFALTLSRGLSFVKRFAFRRQQRNSLQEEKERKKADIFT